nr:ABC transporter transmembrane domain-containing protein [Corynebacterium lactis]
MPTRGPIDPELLRLSAPVRRWVLASGALTALGTAATIALGLVIGSTTAAVLGEATPNWPLFATVAVVAVATKVACSWALARFGQAAGSEATADLRGTALRALALRDPRTIDVSTWRATLTVGLDGIAVYIAEFLPSLVAAALSTPLALATVAWLDLTSFAIAAVTLPLIPLFMWLVGRLTEGRTERRLADIGTVRAQIMDLVEGLPTLRAHGIADAPEAEIQRLSAQHRSSSMAVLRVAFLSSMVLEFHATLSIALIAVGIGFRLLDGATTLATGLAVLIFAPEIYGPVRAVGQKFHAAQDGLVSTRQVTALLSSPVGVEAGSAGASPSGTGQAGAERAEGPVTVEFRELTAPGRDGNRPERLTATALPGALTVLAGPNGVGKTTALLAAAGIVHEGLMGIVQVSDGNGTLSGDALLRRIAWVPQRPVLDPATLGDSSQKSLGQRQRAALERELRDDTRDLILVDEPTAHLDSASAAEVIEALRARARRGATVLAASHDPLLIAAADHVVEVHS